MIHLQLDKRQQQILLIQVYIIVFNAFCTVVFCSRSWVRVPAESYQRLKKCYSLPSRLALDIREWSGKVKHKKLPVDQPPAVAFTAFADMWPGATETEIGAAQCAIGAGKDFDL